MGRSTLLISLAIVTALIAYKVHDMLGDDPVPVIKDEFWGPGSKSGVIPTQKEDEKIVPFKVDFTNPGMIKDLKAKLKAELDAGYAPPLEGVGFKYGFNTNYLKTLMSYWLEKYDFAKREQYLNRYPHFKTKIGGLDIHFQHVKPKDSKKYKKTLPLIAIHGWPGSFVEHQKLVDELVEPKNSEINFEIVVPSLPGYGFSQAASRPGLRGVEIANIFGRLMKRLGYEKYYTLGEDWGAVVSTDMGILYPDRVKGIHSECYSFHPKDILKQTLWSIFSPETTFTMARTRERFLGLKLSNYVIRETGYLHIQSTKPDTIGVALTHSPSGLASYIVEKFATWTNEGKMDKESGGLDAKKFTMDELLDNVMVYWVSKSITSSMRLYSEMFNNWNTFRVPVPVPSACFVGGEDCVVASEVGLQAKYPHLKQFSTAVDAGHFAAYEVPKIIAEKAIKFFGNVEFGRYNTAK